MDESLSPKDIPGEIKRMIDESRFVIADLTYRNAGVYFEIGYAYGIDAPVILTCNENWRIKVDKRANSLKNGSETHKTKDNLDDTDFDILTQDAVHFDIRTDRILFWSNENELKSLLEKEIQRLGIRVKYT